MAKLTNEQWNAAKPKWSQDKARRDACDQDSTTTNRQCVDDDLARAVDLKIGPDVDLQLSPIYSFLRIYFFACRVFYLELM